MKIEKALGDDRIEIEMLKVLDEFPFKNSSIAFKLYEHGEVTDQFLI